MNTVFRPLTALLLIALASACGQMGPLVIPEKTSAAGEPAAAQAPAPEQPEIKPESAPLKVP